MKNNNNDDPIQEALLYAEELARKQMEKEEKKIWSEIAYPLSLSEGLARYTKDELTIIRKKLELPNASSLNKVKLIALLEKEIPHSIQQELLQLDEYRLSIIRKAVFNNGLGSDPKLSLQQVKSLQSLGFIFTGTYEGKRRIIIPEQFVKPLSAFMQDKAVLAAVKRNTEWIKLTQGMLYYCGFLDMFTLSEMLQKHTNEKLKVRDFLNTIYSATEFYENIQMTYHGYAHSRVLNVLLLKKEHEHRPSIDYYPFTKQQLLEASEDDFVERTSYYYNLVTYLLQNYNILPHLAEEIVTECVESAQEGESPTELFDYLQDQIEFDDLESVRSFTDLLVELLNNTRQWPIKGYRPVELRKESKPIVPRNVVPISTIKGMQKTRRNAPCPCGSGKKYKHCCRKR